MVGDTVSKAAARRVVQAHAQQQALSYFREMWPGHGAGWALPKSVWLAQPSSLQWLHISGELIVGEGNIGAAEFFVHATLHDSKPSSVRCVLST